MATRNTSFDDEEAPEILKHVPVPLRVAGAWSWRLIVVGIVALALFSVIAKISALVVPVAVALLIAAPLERFVGVARAPRVLAGVGLASLLLSLVVVGRRADHPREHDRDRRDRRAEAAGVGRPSHPGRLAVVRAAQPQRRPDPVVPRQGGADAAATTSRGSSPARAVRRPRRLASSPRARSSRSSACSSSSRTGGSCGSASSRPLPAQGAHADRLRGNGGMGRRSRDTPRRRCSSRSSTRRESASALCSSA